MSRDMSHGGWCLAHLSSLRALVAVAARAQKQRHGTHPDSPAIHSFFSTPRHIWSVRRPSVAIARARKCGIPGIFRAAGSQCKTSSCLEAPHKRGNFNVQLCRRDYRRLARVYLCHFQGAHACWRQAFCRCHHQHDRCVDSKHDVSGVNIAQPLVEFEQNGKSTSMYPFLWQTEVR
jgi:hypothetical protein